jgi:hypothetical protein
MTPEREHAMAALRAWSAPGVRARLLEQAWLAGETSISALADAANITRPTVYADLESRGINPSTDRQETPRMQTITLAGFTGNETDNDLDTVLRAHLNAWPRTGTDQQREAHAHAGQALLDQHEIAKYHNSLLPLAQAEASDREAAQRALHRVETTWEALSTARAWHAAHHTYVVAVDNARRTIATWQQSATETKGKHYKLTSRKTFDYFGYVPQDQQIVVDTDRPKVAAVDLEETYARRRAIVRETLSLDAGE